MEWLLQDEEVVKELTPAEQIENYRVGIQKAIDFLEDAPQYEESYTRGRTVELLELLLSGNARRESIDLFNYER